LGNDLDLDRRVVFDPSQKAIAFGDGIQNARMFGPSKGSWTVTWLFAEARSQRVPRRGRLQFATTTNCRPDFVLYVIGVALTGNGVATRDTSRPVDLSKAYK
jgi:hypothetical protein